MPSDLLKALGGGSSDDEGPASMGGAKQRAAKDMMRALKSGDAGAFSAALERHYSACGMGSSDSESDDEAY